MFRPISVTVVRFDIRPIVWVDWHTFSRKLAPTQVFVQNMLAGFICIILNDRIPKLNNRNSIIFYWVSINFVYFPTVYPCPSWSLCISDNFMDEYFLLYTEGNHIIAIIQCVTWVDLFQLDTKLAVKRAKLFALYGIFQISQEGLLAACCRFCMGISPKKNIVLHCFSCVLQIHPGSKFIWSPRSHLSPSKLRKHSR